MPDVLTDAEHYPPCAFVDDVMRDYAIADVEPATDPQLLAIAVEMRAQKDWTRPGWLDLLGPAHPRGEVHVTLYTPRIVDHEVTGLRAVRCVSRGATARGEFEAR